MSKPNPSTNRTTDVYAKLDDAILKAISEGRVHFHRINSGVVESIAKCFSVRGDSFRVVDRRLQSLRKRDLVAFKNKEWSIVA